MQAFILISAVLLSLAFSGVVPGIASAAVTRDCPASKARCQSAIVAGDFAENESACRCGLTDAIADKFCLEDTSGVFDTEVRCKEELAKLPPTGKGLSGGGVPKTGAGLLDDIQRIANWVFAIFLAISLIYIILGAFQFVTAGADPAKIQQAREKLIFAVIGIAIGLLVFGIPQIIRSIVV